MTNGEHDNAWMRASEALPNINNNLKENNNHLRIANALAICKELYNIGEMTKDEYIDGLNKMLTTTGCTYTK